MTTPAGAESGTDQQPTATEGENQPGQGQGDDSQQPTGQQEDQNGSQPDHKAEAEKWKALARKHEKQARENARAAQRLQEIEDQGKTEAQRLQERVSKAEQQAQAATAERHRLLAAATHSLGPDLVDYLGDGDEETIFSRAEALSGHINNEVNARVAAELQRYGLRPGSQQPNGAPSAGAAASMALGNRPAESLRPGATPQSDNRRMTPNEAFRQLLGGQ